MCIHMYTYTMYFELYCIYIVYYKLYGTLYRVLSSVQSILYVVVSGGEITTIHTGGCRL